MVWRNLEKQQDTTGKFMEDFVYLFYTILLHSAVTSLPGFQDPQSYFWCAPPKVVAAASDKPTC